MNRAELCAVCVGDRVVRNMVGLEMSLTVSKVDTSREEIHCGPWIFSRRNGAELDDVLGWNERTTGSVLTGHKPQESRTS